MPALDRPQIGTVDIDPEVLALTGERLAELAGRFGFTLDPSTDAPEDGWRLLAQQDRRVVFGAPVDGTATHWRLAVGNGLHGGAISVHPQTMPLRPSRAERARGLALRWPAGADERFDPALAAVDVLNVGGARWRPIGDSFHVAGVIARAGEAAGGVSFAFVAGQDPAFILDPGDYARVRVHIQPEQWRDLEPGAHEVHAALVELGVRTPEPLLIQLTDADIALHRPAATTSAPSRRGHLESRHELLRVLSAAHERFGELTDIISGASSDDEARANIASLLECRPELARSVLDTSLRRFGRAQQAHIADELRAVENALESGENPASSPR
ncbi:hypothetical protein ACWKWP_02430 [Agromyces soli]